jgi:hypothetical protein
MLAGWFPVKAENHITCQVTPAVYVLNALPTLDTFLKKSSIFSSFFWCFSPVSVIFTHTSEYMVDFIN